jgi:CHASE2 domain-containing sensor protein
MADRASIASTLDWLRVLRRAGLYVGVFVVACAPHDLLGLATPSRSRVQDSSNQVLASWYRRAADDRSVPGPPGKIAVVMITDETLERDRNPDNSKRTWPVGYRYHARKIRKILAHQPAGLMIDILFEDKREPVAHLEPAIAALNKRQVPLVLSCGAYCECEGLREDLLEILERKLKNRFTLAPTPKLIGPRDGIVRRYPLMLPIPTEYATDEAEEAFAGERANCRTGALALYRATHPVEDTALAGAWVQSARVKKAMEADREGFSEPMELVWGAPVANGLVVRSTEPDCETLTTSEALARVLIGGEARYGCTPEPALDASRLDGRDALPFRDLDELLRGAYVIYGVDLAGVTDRFSSSVYRRQSGPFVHAMALDNLLKWNRAYARRDRASVLGAGVGALGLALVVGVLWALLHERETWREVWMRLRGSTRLPRPVGRSALLQPVVLMGIVIWFGAAVLFFFRRIVLVNPASLLLAVVGAELVLGALARLPAANPVGRRVRTVDAAGAVASGGRRPTNDYDEREGSGT